MAQRNRIGKLTNGILKGVRLAPGAALVPGHEDTCQTPKVSTKGQVVIPVELREELGIAPGTQIRFERHKEGLLLRPVTKEFVQKMRGFFGQGAPSLEDIREHEHGQDERREDGPRRKER